MKWHLGWPMERVRPVFTVIIIIIIIIYLSVSFSIFCIIILESCQTLNTLDRGTAPRRHRI